MAKTDNFEKYLTTTRFNDHRDPRASYDFYETDYDHFLPEDKDGLIMDIGCGTGEFIIYLKRKGYMKASGIDASPEVVEFCKKRNIDNVELVKDPVYYLSGRPHAFNLVALNDTIEHIPKDSIVGILKAIKSSLKNGGVLLVRTGNFSTPGGVYLRYKDFTHETAYTESSLEQVLRLAGFDDIAIFGNSYRIRSNMLSILRAISLHLWFFILNIIYLIELGIDRPKIYSKLLIAVCKKVN